MPLEKRPQNPLPKGPRPGGHKHKVRDNETLESIARHHGISTSVLIQHNFATTDPKEINWYLREHVGCVLATHDQKNWRFSAHAEPGFIYIPRLNMDPEYVFGKVPPVDLCESGLLPLLPSFKFVPFELLIPPQGPKDLGFLLAQLKISVEGELKHECGPLKVALKKNEVKASIEKRLSEVSKGIFSVTYDSKKLAPVLDAIKKGDLQAFARELGKLVEVSIKTTYAPVDPITVEVEAGLQASITPVTVRFAVKFEERYQWGVDVFKASINARVTLNVGLSANGWKWVVDNLGPQAVKRFLVERALPQILEWLAIESVLMSLSVLIAIPATIALHDFTLSMTKDRAMRGDAIGVITYCGQAYVNRVFGDRRPAGPGLTGYTRIAQDLMAMAERDALTDARSALQTINDPAAQGTDQQALAAYGRLVMAAYGPNELTARARLRQVVEEKMFRAAGLKP